MTIVQRWASALRLRLTDAGYIMALLMLSLTVNVYQAYTSAETPSRPDVPRVAVGDAVPDISATASDGTPVSIRFANPAGRPTVLYVLSPNCIWCQRNLANIRHLSREKDSAFRFVGLSLTDTGLEQHLRDVDYGGLDVYIAPPESVERLHLGATPQTLVVSASGTVLRNWLGAFTDELGAEVESFFDVDLPGLTNDLVVKSRSLCVDKQGRRFSPGFVQKSHARECGADGMWLAYIGR